MGDALGNIMNLVTALKDEVNKLENGVTVLEQKVDANKNAISRVHLHFYSTKKEGEYTVFKDIEAITATVKTKLEEVLRSQDSKKITGVEKFKALAARFM
jgi:hypothetical protein